MSKPPRRVDAYLWTDERHPFHDLTRRVLEDLTPFVPTATGGRDLALYNKLSRGVADAVGVTETVLFGWQLDARTVPLQGRVALAVAGQQLAAVSGIAGAGERAEALLRVSLALRDTYDGEAAVLFGELPPAEGSARRAIHLAEMLAHSPPPAPPSGFAWGALP